MQQDQVKTPDLLGVISRKSVRLASYTLVRKAILITVHR